MMYALRWLPLVGVGCGGLRPIAFTNENNYAFSNTVSFPSVEVKAGEDAHVDWSALTVDVRERPITEIQQIVLGRADYPLDQLLELISVNDLDAQQEMPETFVFDRAGATAADFSEFEIGAQSFDPALLFSEDAGSTWLLSAVNYPEGRLDVLSTVALVPRDASDNTSVTLADGGMTLDWSVDLSRGAPIATGAGLPPKLDWSGWTRDVYGNPVDLIRADQLVIAHFDQSVAEVEAGFLQLDSIATEFYRASVVGATELEQLDEAVDTSTGASFAGFTPEGTWLLGFGCTTCSTPVPLGLAVVSVQ